MSNCPKGTNYLIVDSNNNQIRTLSFSSDRKLLEIRNASTGALECSIDIDSGSYLGVDTNGMNLFFSNPISGTTSSLRLGVGSNPVISVQEKNSALEVIGVNDIGVAFAAPRLNIRYNANDQSVYLQL